LADSITDTAPIAGTLRLASAQLRRSRRWKSDDIVGLVVQFAEDGDPPTAEEEERHRRGRPDVDP
jgi:hypothetical protein